ncbi:iron-containing alcohol dehydrogenase [Desulfobulbus rhabdoformis]|uniref:iron-containing alcohol dehydrogenase n=1 Tax=Desulfobulbus rhabdoformis TaxID=34032 RepID=UPI001962768F|nr:iron-containing alcohol dehydrogenase [Desulfobulbus rhabdoformis]MBM9616174.1 iron-containing alcohol dehydrogenase [Desulfobulbus rhabdoformis]
MAFTHFVPTKILFGPGQIKKLHEQNLPGKKALIVISSGTSTRKFGYLDTVINELSQAGKDHVVFDKIQANPTKTNVMDGAAQARENGCDFVIGLGGGSCLDASKAIAIMAANPGDYWDYIHGGSGKGQPVEKTPLPMVAITTTAGTGTEADPWAVVTNEVSNEKIGFGMESTFPVLSVVDPEMMVSVPPSFTAYQGFDALFHSVEGYISKNANAMSDIYALAAIENVAANLAQAVKDGSDLNAREKVALGNTLSGFVESICGVTSQHSLEHALSAAQPALPHGAGLIMLSRAFFTHFAKSGACDERMIAMAKAMGKTDAGSAMDFVAALVELQEACGVAELKMSAYGLKKEDMARYALDARETMGKLFSCDPVALSDADSTAILEASFR